MLFDQRDEIRGRVASQRGFREVFVSGNEILRLAIEIGEITTAAAGDQDLLADAFGMLQHGDTQSAFAGFDRAKQSRGAGAENHSVEFTHQERLSLEPKTGSCRISAAMTSRLNYVQEKTEEFA